jgi:RNA polymerase sigma-70 factor (ECF subfamily)
MEQGALETRHGFVLSTGFPVVSIARVTAPVATPHGDLPDRFHTTRWSLIVSAADSGTEDEKSREALTHLCQIYWRPVFAFICRHGAETSEAQDLTQEFFLKVLRSDLLHVADARRGRFRSLLLTALQNFLRDVDDYKGRIKRGGGVQFVSWDDWTAEAPSYLTLPREAVESWPPERLFDVRWAATVVEQALRRLREECERRGRRRVFDALAECLSADRAEVCYDDAARLLGVAVTTIKPLVRRLRQRYRELLREEVAETVESDADVDDEIRYLCSMLAAASA